MDGTYELFRSYYGAPSRQAPDGRQVGATFGLLGSLLSLVTRSGATHIGCAFDHVIESFRNELYSEYKTGEGVDPDLLAQFPLAEDGVEALGMVIWPMIEFEADDALAAATEVYVEDPRVDQVVVCSPDKDLAQLVRGDRVVCWDRRRDLVYHEPAIREKYGVAPESIPDWLALVGDSADGYPGLPGWGAKSAAAVLGRYGHLEDIPGDPATWGLPEGRAARLAEALRAGIEEAFLFRRLATLRRDVPIPQSLSDLEWRGAKPELREFCTRLGYDGFPERVQQWIQSP